MQSLAVVSSETIAVDIPCSKDAGITARYPFANFGGQHSCIVGLLGASFGPPVPSRCLMFFDIQEMVPTNAKVTQAILHLSFEHEYGEVENETHSLHMVSNGWDEGDELGVTYDLAKEGSCTWDHSSSPILWDTPGGDFKDDAFATFEPPLRGTGAYNYRSEISVPIPAPFIQELLNAPNKGFILLGDESAGEINFRAFRTRETGSSPTLTVEYEDDPVSTNGGSSNQSTVNGDLDNGDDVNSKGDANFGNSSGGNIHRRLIESMSVMAITIAVALFQ